MKIPEGELRLYPEDCLVGDWVCAKMVPHWEWSAEASGHVMAVEGCVSKIFEILPYIGALRQVVWQRTS